jgi:hypothetical protein
MKVVINRCYGGFGLSNTALIYLIEKKGWKVTEIDETGFPEDESAPIQKLPKTSYRDETYWLAVWHEKWVRCHPDLIDVVEKLGKQANGFLSDLRVVEIPDDVEWEIKEYDGLEWVSEKHRTWTGEETR